MRRALGLVALAGALAAPATAQRATAVWAQADALGAALVVTGEQLPQPVLTHDVRGLYGRAGALVALFTPVRTSAGLPLGPWADPVRGVVAAMSGDTLRLVVNAPEGARWGVAAATGDGVRLVVQRPAPAALPAAPEPAFYTLGNDAAWGFEPVVLDAGHGGRDVGAVAHGTREKDVTLGVVRRLGRLLAAAGVRVVYTRTADVFVPLQERGRRANAAEGRLFVSVHVNATATGAPARGTETYLLGPHRSDAALAVMERENSVVRFEADAQAYAAYGDGAVQALLGSAFSRSSERLAALVEAQFRAQGRASRGVRQAGFYVLWSAAMPAVLVETGFVNDPAEAAYLRSDAGQQAVAEAIFRAIRALMREDAAAR